MDRFFFELYSDGLAIWDDEGAACDGRRGIEARARQLVEKHAKQHIGGEAPVSVVVLDESHTVIATAIREGHGTRMAWTSTRVG
ncbi:DUF6894 family protein [Methylorubrum extorquens]